MLKAYGLQCYPRVFGQCFLASSWWDKFDGFSQLTYNAYFLLTRGFANITPTGGSIQGLAFAH